MAKAKAKSEAPQDEGAVIATVYLKHVTPKGSYITEHQCWNAKLFVASAFKVALESGDGAVEQVTEADYIAWKGARGPK